jgi:hypothetical protein
LIATFFNGPIFQCFQCIEHLDKIF